MRFVVLLYVIASTFVDDVFKGVEWCKLAHNDEVDESHFVGVKCVSETYRPDAEH